jgi:hypothetical protein
MMDFDNAEGIKLGRLRKHGGANTVKAFEGAEGNVFMRGQEFHIEDFGFSIPQGLEHDAVVRIKVIGDPSHKRAMILGYSYSTLLVEIMA